MTDTPRTRRRSASAAKRTHELTIRLAPDELESVRAAAVVAGATMADLARRRLLDAGADLALAGVKKPTRRRSYPEADPALLREIARIGNNVNQIARWCNTHQAGIARVELLAQLAALEKAFLSLLPRKAEGRAASEVQDHAH